MIENLMTVFSLFAFGAVVGSFLNVVALRFIAGEEIVFTPSHCPRCNHRLSWFENIPIISYIFLRAHCRSCGAAISVQYPLVELAAGLTALMLFLPGATNYTLFQAIIVFVFVCVLLVLWVIDARTFLLPDQFIIGLGIVAIVFYIQKEQWQYFPSAILGAVLGGGFLYMLWLITKKQGIGFGDVKLMIPVGFLLGWQGVIVCLFLSFIIGGALASFLLVTARVNLKTAVPFGPYLAGTAIVLLTFPHLSTLVLGLLGWPL